MAKTKKIEYLDAWAVMPKDIKQLEFSPCSCPSDGIPRESLWRYPIFSTRREARAYKLAVDDAWQGVVKRVYLRVEYK